jgi:hypothetical protein
MPATHLKRRAEQRTRRVLATLLFFFFFFPPGFPRVPQRFVPRDGPADSTGRGARAAAADPGAPAPRARPANPGHRQPPPRARARRTRPRTCEPLRKGPRPAADPVTGRRRPRARDAAGVCGPVHCVGGSGGAPAAASNRRRRLSTRQKADPRDLAASLFSKRGTSGFC